MRSIELDFCVFKVADPSFFADPPGSFICSYSGVILDNQTAEEQGQQCDTYLADLDMIENLEEAKDGQYGPQFGQLGDDDDQWNGKDFRQLYDESHGYAINGNLKGNIGR